jgi:formate hydrogenlyase subunit 3/multisubunit Na+/H+ antiporter MnhD subunit
VSTIVAVGWPLLVLVGLFARGRVRAWAERLAPWAPLPLLLPLLVGGSISLPWFLLGTNLGVDPVNRPLLWLTLLGWTLAGWAADVQVRERRRRFWAGWLMVLSGMILLLLAGDLASFYVGYAVVSISAYLLVTHAANAEALRAGRIYMIMAVAGEAAVLIGVLLLAGAVGNAPFTELLAHPDPFGASTARWWLLAGFAVKLGIVPLHVWLPLAHPVAPAPASAILSGIIVKAGLIGWLRFVPPLPGDARAVGEVLLLLGLVTAFGGVALGLAQRRLKTVLAYSTISQMGLILTGFSLAFLVPDGRDAVIPVLGLLALHHGLNKASLFVAAGAAPGASIARLALFALPALALAAAPLATGYVAKEALKQTLALASLAPTVEVVLSLTSTATALLLWKAFGMARQLDRRDVPLHPAWPLLVLAATVAPWWFAAAADLLPSPSPEKLWAAAWPLGLAALLIVVQRPLLRGRTVAVPEGDWVVGVERAVAWAHVRARRPAPAATTTAGGGAGDGAAPRVAHVLLWVEAAQQRLPSVGLALLVVGALLWALIIWARVG